MRKKLRNNFWSCRSQEAILQDGVFPVPGHLAACIFQSPSKFHPRQSRENKTLPLLFLFLPPFLVFVGSRNFAHVEFDVSYPVLVAAPSSRDRR